MPVEQLAKQRTILDVHPCIPDAASRAYGKDFADPLVLAIFRICFSLVGLGYLGSYWLNLDLLSAQHAATQPYAQAACIYAICTLILRLIGWGGRTVSLTHFLSVTWLLTRNFPAVTVNEELYLILSFWSCFMRLDGALAVEGGRNPEPQPAWPVNMLAINLGVYLLSAGLFKLADPEWLNGSVAGSLCLTSYMCPEIFASFAKFELPMKLTTYSIMLVELLWLPLFFVPWLRVSALAVLFVFFFGLIIPLRLDWIGEVGCCAPLALAAISPAAARGAHILLGKLSTRLSRWNANTFEPQSKTFERGEHRGLLEITIALPVATLLLTMSLVTLMVSPWGPAERNQAEAFRAQALAPTAKRVLDWLSQINVHTICLGPKNMFTADQRARIGPLFIYRIEVTTIDGRKIIPLESFREDGKAGKDMNRPGEIKYPQDLMVPISRVCDSLSQAKSPEPARLREVDYILEWAARRTNVRPKSVQLFAAPDWEPSLKHAQPKPHWKLYCTWTPERGTIAIR